jgi:hypothetical protein
MGSSDPCALGSEDRSERISDNVCIASGIFEGLAGSSGSTAEGSNTAVQAAQPDYRDAIFYEIQNVDGLLWQICEILADDADVF